MTSIDDILDMLDRLGDDDGRHESAGLIASQLREAITNGDEVRVMKLERHAWRHVRTQIGRALAVLDPATVISADDLLARLPAKMRTDEQRRAAERLMPCQRAQLLAHRDRFAQSPASPAGFLRRALAHCRRTRGDDDGIATLIADLPPHQRRHEVELARELTAQQIAVCRHLGIRPSEFTTAMEHEPFTNQTTRERETTCSPET